MLCYCPIKLLYHSKHNGMAAIKTLVMSFVL